MESKQIIKELLEGVKELNGEYQSGWDDVILRAENYLKCELCGVETIQPVYDCYKAPINLEAELKEIDEQYRFVLKETEKKFIQLRKDIIERAKRA